ncbi:MAG: UDP-3-O-[3-hydroxymyristoyl] N-acetylglucosamine deacetylase [Planctomycetes bacterium]|nr:UDP-3-O-[3-hydroxymyristoyl] N-acetylglucosamine deacetylase [Planctomycetota bacterium]
MARSQRTIKTPFEIEGVGLHEGRPVRVSVRPAKPDTGVLFVRSDLPDADPVPAVLDSLAEADRRTLLRVGEAEVHTVEHLLASLVGCRIDNLEVELDAAEMPALDGSAQPWCEALKKAGAVDQKAPRKVFTVERPFFVQDGSASIHAVPARGGTRVSYTLDYRSRGMPAQLVEYDLDATDVPAEIAPARTFVFSDEAEALQREGLGAGARSGENTLVFDGSKLLEGELRFPDEPARHKVLDLLGDLFLLGADVEGSIAAVRSGHRTHHELVRVLKQAMELEENHGRIVRGTAMDIREIAGLLPHRYPFLLVDRVLELEGYRRAVGIKNVTVNEPFFQGHFPGQPIMPGVLILEALAQLAGTLLLRRMEYTGKLPVLWAIDKVKLRRSVIPGDQLRLEVEATKVRDTMGRVSCLAKVNEHVAAEAKMVFTLVDAG